MMQLMNEGILNRNMYWFNTQCLIWLTPNLYENKNFKLTINFENADRLRNNSLFAIALYQFSACTFVAEYIEFR